MSLSFIAFTRFQSVLEIFEKEDFFILSGPPKRDHVNAFRDFRVRDRNCDTIQKSQRDEALLTVGKTVVLVRRRGPFEYAPGICEVKPMISEICLSLSLVPRKAHLRSVYTCRTTVN